MSGQHTPGPWVAIPCPVRHNWKASKPIFPEGLWRILPEANVERVPIAEVDRSDDHDLPTRLSAEADARLIAAAPQLLEALEASQEILSKLLPNWSHETAAQIRANAAAIAAATGGAA